MFYQNYDRPLAAPYYDPLDIIWISAAAELGFTIARRSDLYAWYDGKGTIALATPDDMDPDDNLAQLIFHELCHALVAGPEKAKLPDWGLPPMEDGDYLDENATNRLQAALAQRFDLRQFFGTTTVFRKYYDLLPDDPLAPDDEDPAVAVARNGWARAQEEPWRGVMQRALGTTAAVHKLIAAVPYPAATLWHSATVHN